MNKEDLENLVAVLEKKNSLTTFLNSPIVLAGALFGLALFIYKADQTNALNRYEQLSKQVERVSSIQLETQNSVTEITRNQEILSQTIEKLFSKVEKNSSSIGEINSSRFKPDQFPVYAQPIIQRVENNERELNRRTETVNDVKALKDDMMKVKASIEIIKNSIENIEAKVRNQ